MIKVIKQPKKLTCVCNNCKAELEYERNDINYIRIAMNEYKEYILCPCCGHEIVLSWEQY